MTNPLNATTNLYFITTYLQFMVTYLVQSAITLAQRDFVQRNDKSQIVTK